MKTKGQVISERIMNKFSETASMRVAFDSVMGEGAYEKLAGEVYEALRSNDRR